MTAQTRAALISTGRIAPDHLYAAQRVAWRTWGSELQTRTFCLERLAVVHTCSPNNPHILSAEALIRAGIHVVLEKPVDTTVIFQVSEGRKNRL